MNRSRKLKCWVMFPGRRRFTKLPARREQTRIRLEMAVTMIMERGGTFILLTPYTKPAANASTDRAVTRSRISNRYEYMKITGYTFMVIVFRGFCSVSCVDLCYCFSFIQSNRFSWISFCFCLFIWASSWLTVSSGSSFRKQEGDSDVRRISSSLALVMPT